MEDVNKQLDIIDVVFEDGEYKSNKIQKAIDFHDISKLTCWIVYELNNASVDILAVFSKERLAKNYYRRLIPTLRDRNVNIIESVMYNDCSIINNTVSSIKLNIKAIDADFINKDSRLKLNQYGY